MIKISLTDHGKLDRLLALHLSGDKRALADNPADLVLTGFICDPLRNQRPVSPEYHINVKVDSFVSDLRCHAQSPCIPEDFDCDALD